MQASDAATQVSAAELAEELLSLWHHLMRGQSKTMFSTSSTCR
jgi:hypothetical protein